MPDTTGKPLLSLIAAVASNGIIGAQGRMPWRIPDDGARFRRLTMGHAVVMGRVTFASMGKPLEGRKNIVLTRATSLDLAGALVVHTPAEAMAQAAGDSEVFVIGGADVYALFLPQADRMYITWVEAAVDGDVSFPPVAWDAWDIAAETMAPDAPGVLPHRFVDYVRKRT